MHKVVYILPLSGKRFSLGKRFMDQRHSFMHGLEPIIFFRTFRTGKKSALDARERPVADRYARRSR